MAQFASLALIIIVPEISFDLLMFGLFRHGCLDWHVAAGKWELGALFVDLSSSLFSALWFQCLDSSLKYNEEYRRKLVDQTIILPPSNQGR